ncbi:hypothetical protein RI054_01g05750 [Pseudoscourfieldia marina]
MAAPGGADQPELAEQIQLLREQNNLLVQQNLQLQQGRPAARVQPQPERRRFLEPPTEADLDEQRLYLIPATLTRGPNSHRLPTDVAGAQGEPHLLNLTSEYIYLHAVEKGKKHDSTVLRILLSLLSYLEVLEFGLSPLVRALAAEALTENLVAAVEAQLRPVAAVEQEGAEEEARLLAAGQRAQLLERLRGIDNGTTLVAETVARAAGSAEGVRAIAAYGEGLQRTYLSPDHLVPHFLRLAVETSESIAAHVDTSSDALNTQVNSFRRIHAEKSAKLAAERAAGISAGGQLGDRTPNGAKDKELKKLRAEIAKLRKDKV